MGKLHLKETPEERQKRKVDKAEKSRHKSRKHIHRTARRASEDYSKPEKKRHQRSTDDDGHASQTHVEAIEAEFQEKLFREKLYDAMLDDYDNRLDNIEAEFNEYAHIPRRWQSTARVDDPTSINNLRFMDDEEYAEWIREGMWRRTHRAEMEEKNRRATEAKARIEREKKARAESKRLEREAEARREAKRKMKELRQRQEARDYYDARWKECITSKLDQRLRFNDIPWPVFSVVTEATVITEEHISEFIFYQIDEGNLRARKERIKEALLRWHPDKFESKLGPKLREKEKGLILEGVGVVARCLNNLMTNNKGVHKP